MILKTFSSSWLPCQILVDCMCLGLFLGPQFYCIGLFICFYASLFLCFDDNNFAGEFKISVIPPDLFSLSGFLWLFRIFCGSIYIPFSTVFSLLLLKYAMKISKGVALTL